MQQCERPACAGLLKINFTQQPIKIHTQRTYGCGVQHPLEWPGHSYQRGLLQDRNHLASSIGEVVETPTALSVSLT